MPLRKTRWKVLRCESFLGFWVLSVISRAKRYNMRRRSSTTILSTRAFNFWWYLVALLRVLDNGNWCDVPGWYPFDTKFYPESAGPSAERYLTGRIACKHTHIFVPVVLVVMKVIATDSDASFIIRTSCLCSCCCYWSSSFDRDSVVLGLSSGSVRQTPFVRSSVPLFVRSSWYTLFTCCCCCWKPSWLVGQLRRGSDPRQ